MLSTAIWLFRVSFKEFAYNLEQNINIYVIIRIAIPFQLHKIILHIALSFSFRVSHSALINRFR